KQENRPLKKITIERQGACQASAKNTARIGAGSSSAVCCGLSECKNSGREWKRIHSVARCSAVVVAQTSTTRGLLKPIFLSQEIIVSQLGINQTLFIFA